MDKEYTFTITIEPLTFTLRCVEEDSKDGWDATEAIVNGRIEDYMEAIRNGLDYRDQDNLEYLYEANEVLP